MGARADTPLRPTSLAAPEARAAGKVVFAWILLPAASRLVGDASRGRDAAQASADLRAVVRLLDRLGWPDEPSGPTSLDAREADLVRHAARAHVGHGFDPDRQALARVARGPVHETLTPGGSMGRLVSALEQDV